MLNKTIYFYWENHKMSFLRYMSIKSWIHHNPDFKVVLITKKKKSSLSSSMYKECQDINYFDGECYWNKCLKLPLKLEYLEIDYPNINSMRLQPQQTSDILTWYILSIKGGIVSDTDIIFTNPFDYEKYKNIDVSIFSYYNNFAIGFMFGTPNKVYSNIYNLSLRENKDNYQNVGANLLYKYFIMHGNTYDINIRYIINPLIYPFVNLMSWEDNLHYPWVNKCIVNEITCGIHYYAGADISKDFNSKLTINNYKEYDNTISYYIDKCLTKQ